ncbi:MAG: ABC transporter substrate-binding protein [Propionibacteriaceae bacterium]|nr:ABC transporter substrate-binding protein [Propionibacteriaceae bacterium]
MARHGWRQRLTTALAGSLTMMMLAACGSTGVSSPGADTAPTSGEVQAGGTLTHLEPQTWNTLYPPSAGFYPNGVVVNNITDRLLYQNPETLELEPWIATALPEVNEDATQYTFTIRDDVTYSDGTPLTAENVVKNFDLYGVGDPDRALPVSEAINNYDHGEVIDATTVRFHFSAPAPGSSHHSPAPLARTTVTKGRSTTSSMLRMSTCARGAERNCGRGDPRPGAALSAAARECHPEPAVRTRTAAPRGTVVAAHGHVYTAASTDMGNVSELIPAIQPTIGIGTPAGISPHNPEFARYTTLPAAHQAVEEAAVALASAAADWLADPVLRERAQAEFDARGPATRG